jgi:fructose-1,6-bisphosphatase/inositol monophosphatase family enzyme
MTKSNVHPTLYNYDMVPEMMIDVARDHILPYYNNLHSNQIQQKTSPKDLVCVADLEAENAFRKKIQGLHPGLMFVGEESYYETGCQKVTTGGVNDSVDGSIHFINGLETFCSMQSFLENALIIYGAVYQPLANVMVIAKYGQGVMYNGQNINSNKALETRPRIYDQITIGHITGEFAAPELRPLLDNAQKNGLCIGDHICASMDYIRFVRGEVDNIVYKNAYPWDVAAGALIFEEMGGRAALLHSEKDLITNLFDDIHQPVLMTRRKDDWSAVKGALLS